MPTFRLSLLTFLLVTSQIAAQPTAEQLAMFDLTVAPEAERKQLTQVIPDRLRQLQREANARSTAEWNRITNREQWEAFVKPKLAALRESLGAFPEPKRPAVRYTSTFDGDGFSIDNVLYESRPGFWVSANLYRPRLPSPSMPALMIIHAHHTPKEHGELQDMGMTWARAGCLVLVPDMLGHGERRQHPFIDAKSFPGPFRVSRQDYYFRYDNAIRLQSVGESLMGWMVWDIWRGFDVLLQQKGCDPKRLILLGSVAGGGDPCAVAAALDDRIAAAVPFNFGGPQPESRYPLPDDAETSFNYMGGGSWESTRNLARSGKDGFLPWVIVGSLASRKLIYAHEFNWDRERDPVWKRLQKIAGFFNNADGLAYSYGRGSVRGSSPDDTHCTHIGPVQRKSIHEAFRKWFGIEATEYRNRVPASTLTCWTERARKELQPRSLAESLKDLAAKQKAEWEDRLERKTADRSKNRDRIRKEWTQILGSVAPSDVRVRDLGHAEVNGVRIEKQILMHEETIPIPVVILRPVGVANPPVVLAIAQAGKSRLVSARASDYARLLANGVAICLPDVRGTGETSTGSGRGRTSAATSYASSFLMHGEPQIAGQLRDLRAVIAWLRKSKSVNGQKLILWGGSLAERNDPRAPVIVPHDSDELPKLAEPMGGLLAMMASFFGESLTGVIVSGMVYEWSSITQPSMSCVPYDSLIPGIVRAGDLDALRNYRGLDRVLVDLVTAQNQRDDRHPDSIMVGNKPVSQILEKLK